MKLTSEDVLSLKDNSSINDQCNTQIIELPNLRFGKLEQLSDAVSEIFIFVFVFILLFFRST